MHYFMYFEKKSVLSNSILCMTEGNFSSNPNRKLRIFREMIVAFYFSDKEMK